MLRHESIIIISSVHFVAKMMKRTLAQWEEAKSVKLCCKKNREWRMLNVE